MMEQHDVSSTFFDCSKIGKEGGSSIFNLSISLRDIMSDSYLHDIATGNNVTNNAPYGLDQHLDTSDASGFDLGASEKSGIENEENENFLQEFLTEGSQHTDHSKEIEIHENDSDDDDESSIEEEIITTHTLHPTHSSVMVNHNNYHNHQFAAVNHNMLNVAMAPGMNVAMPSLNMAMTNNQHLPQHVQMGMNMAVGNQHSLNMANMTDTQKLQHQQALQLQIQEQQMRHQAAISEGHAYQQQQQQQLHQQQHHQHQQLQQHQKQAVQQIANNMQNHQNNQQQQLNQQQQQHGGPHLVLNQHTGPAEGGQYYSKGRLRWTDHMDRLLKEGVEKHAGHGVGMWKKVAEYVSAGIGVSSAPDGNGKRVVSNHQCGERYKHHLDPQLDIRKAGPWSESDVEALRTLVAMHTTRDDGSSSSSGAGPKKPLVNWVTVAIQLNRHYRDCQHKWINICKADLKTGQFTREEEDLIVQRVTEWGDRGKGIWVTLEKELGRRNRSILDKYKRLIRKKGN